MVPFGFRCQLGHDAAKKPESGKEAQPGTKRLGAPKPSRTDQAKQVVEDYAADLREIVKKLREKLN